MAASPQHATLVAATITTITLSADWPRIEVYNVDGADIVYFTVNGVDPVAAATGTNVIGAVKDSLTVPKYAGALGASGGAVVKLISAGTPKVSVRGVL